MHAWTLFNAQYDILVIFQLFDKGSECWSYPNCMAIRYLHLVVAQSHNHREFCIQSTIYWPIMFYTQASSNFQMFSTTETSKKIETASYYLPVEGTNASGLLITGSSLVLIDMYIYQLSFWSTFWRWCAAITVMKQWWTNGKSSREKGKEINSGVAAIFLVQKSHKPNIRLICLRNEV